MKSVIIMGGGIAGLTAAHELAECGYKVMIIERNAQLGGVARSLEYDGGKICPMEYSWRAFGPYYHNANNIIQRIPLINDPNQTVADNFVQLEAGENDCKKTNNFIHKPLSIPFRDSLTIAEIMSSYFTSCDKRNIDMYSGENWNDYLQKRNIADITYNQHVRILGPILGFDNEKVSVYDMGRGNEMFAKYALSTYLKKFYITKLPINLAWFNHWEKYLQSLDVNILKSTSITDIHVQNENVIGVTTDSGATLTADYYISALPVESIADLVRKTPSLLSLQNLIPLAKNGRQVQLSAQIYLDRRAYTQRKVDYLYIANSPWAIIILPEGEAWRGHFDLREYCKDAIKDIWSVGICETSKPGLLIKKPFTECTPEEVALETWHQIISTPGIDDSVCVEHGTMKDINVIDFKIWPSFQYKNGRLDTYEPKWANNVNTKKYRPNAVTDISNLVIAGAYTDTSIGIYGMEGAVESGKLAARSILDKDSSNTNVYIHEHQRICPVLLAPLRAVDSVLYNNDLPQLSCVTFGSNILLILIYFILIAYLVYKGSQSIINKSLVSNGQL
jgi:hypothetical protein